MIELKDVMQLWLKTNKNIGRSWEIIQDHAGVYVIKPIYPRRYFINAKLLLLEDAVQLHYDDPNETCHHATVMAYDKEFFDKIVKWMRFVRR